MFYNFVSGVKITPHPGKGSTFIAFFAFKSFSFFQAIISIYTHGRIGVWAGTRLVKVVKFISFRTVR